MADSSRDSSSKTAKKRRQEETPEQREERLQRRWVLDRLRRKCETPKDRQKAYRERRKASRKNDDQRAARLTHLSHNEHERLASETDEQRAARLAQLSHNRQERLASETGTRRHDRRQITEQRSPQTIAYWMSEFPCWICKSYCLFYLLLTQPFFKVLHDESSDHVIMYSMFKRLILSKALPSRQCNVHKALRKPVCTTHYAYTPEFSREGSPPQCFTFV